MTAWFSPNAKRPNDGEDVLVILRSDDNWKLAGWYDTSFGGQFFLLDAHGPSPLPAIKYPADEILAWTYLPEFDVPMVEPEKFFHIEYNGEVRGDFDLADTVKQFPWYDGMDHDDPLALNIGGTEIKITPFSKFPEPQEAGTFIVASTASRGMRLYLYAFSAQSEQDALEKARNTSIWLSVEEPVVVARVDGLTGGYLGEIRAIDLSAHLQKLVEKAIKEDEDEDN